MERVDKYRDDKGRSVLHMAVNIAIRDHDTTSLEEILSIKLQVYEANENGQTCLY